jgi:hypothetical protein
LLTPDESAQIAARRFVVGVRFAELQTATALYLIKLTEIR